LYKLVFCLSFLSGPAPTIYNSETTPYGQIFWLGDIVRMAGGNFTSLSISGGVVSISIQWKCDLDFDFQENCLPKYIFRVLGMI
jgi:P2X purinoceptor 3